MQLQKKISSYCLSVICEMLKELVRASFSGALKNNENNSSFDTMTQGHPEMKLICLDFSKQTEGSASQSYSCCFFKLIFGLLIIQRFFLFHTITYKSRLTQKKLHKKTDGIFSIYGKNGIIP